MKIDLVKRAEIEAILNSISDIRLAMDLLDIKNANIKLLIKSIIESEDETLANELKAASTLISDWSTNYEDWT